MRRPTGATQRWHEATAAWVVHWKSTRNDPVSAKWCTWCYSCLWRVFESVPVVYYALSFARILSIAPVLSIAPSLAPVLPRATSRPEPHPEDGTALPRTRPVDPQSGAAQASHVLGREGQQGAAPAAGRQRGGATHISPTARPVTSGGAASPRIALPAPPGHSGAWLPVAPSVVESQDRLDAFLGGKAALLSPRRLPSAQPSAHPEFAEQPIAWRANPRRPG